jgi:hypothetical protein
MTELTREQHLNLLRRAIAANLDARHEHNKRQERANRGKPIAATARSAKAEITESGYCSRSPIVRTRPSGTRGRRHVPSSWRLRYSGSLCPARDTDRKDRTAVSSLR